MYHSYIANIAIALKSIRGHMLRTVLTILIIAIGITALVGILTAIDSIKSSINKEFSMMGANTFTIRNRGLGIRIGKDGKRPKRYRPLSFKEACTFKNTFEFPSTVSISMLATWQATLKYRDKKTNPNIGIIGADENYLRTGGFEIARGRNFSAREVMGNSRVIIIGNELAETLFGNNENPLDKTIGVGSSKFRIIGILKEKGSSMGFGGDKNSIIPLGIARQEYEQEGTSYTISAMASGPEQVDPAIGEAETRFRVIRKDRLRDE
ncbi:MAG: ABC transporter permease, partial [Flavobacteriales bacterium]